VPDDSLATRLSSVIAELGDDVAVEHRGPFVAFSRARQFAELEPHAARVDLALVLPGADETERLRPSERFGTHLVSLAHEDEIDAELTEWLRSAYSAAAT
jgi:predicted transport protein